MNALKLFVAVVRSVDTPGTHALNPRLATNVANRAIFVPSARQPWVEYTRSPLKLWLLVNICHHLLKKTLLVKALLQTVQVMLWAIKLSLLLMLGVLLRVVVLLWVVKVLLLFLRQRGVL